MSPTDEAILAARLDAFMQRFEEHAERTERNFREVKRENREIKGKQDETNGSVRRLQIWQAEVKGALGAGRLSFTAVIAPLFVGVVVAIATALLFLALTGHTFAN